MLMHIPNLYVEYVSKDGFYSYYPLLYFDTENKFGFISNAYAEKVKVVSTDHFTLNLVGEKCLYYSYKYREEVVQSVLQRILLGESQLIKGEMSTAIFRFLYGNHSVFLSAENTIMEKSNLDHVPLDIITESCKLYEDRNRRIS